jgi:hypothetical protein
MSSAVAQKPYKNADPQKSEMPEQDKPFAQYKIGISPDDTDRLV